MCDKVHAKIRSDWHRVKEIQTYIYKYTMMITAMQQSKAFKLHGYFCDFQ